MDLAWGLLPTAPFNHACYLIVTAIPSVGLGGNGYIYIYVYIYMMVVGSFLVGGGKVYGSMCSGMLGNRPFTVGQGLCRTCAITTTHLEHNCSVMQSVC